MKEIRKIYNGHKVPADLSHFWVVTVITNPMRYSRRYELYFRFEEMCRQAGVKLITVEQAFGNREFMVTDSNNPHHVQMRSHEILWLKENGLNVGMQRARELDPLAREIAWIDADCRPMSDPKHWFEETWHQLQVYEIVQMWSYLVDLDRHHNPSTLPVESFMRCYINAGCPSPQEFKKLREAGLSEKHHHRHRHHDHCHHHKRHRHHHHKHHHEHPYGTNRFGRPGLAWAANVSALDALGRLIDFSILGAADWYQAHALIGSLASISSEYRPLSPYAQKLFEWQARAERWIKRDVGYVNVSVLHDTHGSKQNREYGTRGKILFKWDYAPDRDIKYGTNGLLQLETNDDRQIGLRDDIRAYFGRRCEDDIYDT